MRTRTLGRVFSWLRRRREPLDAPRIRSRDELGDFTRVDLADLTPEPAELIARAVLLELYLVEETSACLRETSDLAVKQVLASATGVALRRNDALVGLIRADPDATVAAVLEPFAAAVRAFALRVATGDWHERLLGVYVAGGFLEDFYAQLALGLAGDTRTRMTDALLRDGSGPELAELLEREIAADPALAARLALWGRRLVGDLLLFARAALAVPADALEAEARIEPVFTGLIAEHTRRMDRLGLTA